MPRLKKGTVVFETFSSRLLKNNPLKDPAERLTPVYLPPGYGAEPQRRYPALYLLSGFTGSGPMLLNRQAWEETLPEKLDRLIGAGKAAEMIVVMPDCFTRYGGSKYVNSSATGRYEDYVVREIVPWADRLWRTIPKAEARAVMGKSSGGYGAFRLGVRHPDVFGHLACHSGDMYFEYCYKTDFPRYCADIARFGGGAKFLKAFGKMTPNERKKNFPAVNILAMAACYSPNLRAPMGFDLPFDERTGLLKPGVWKRWEANDPVFMARALARNLKRLKSIYLDCGTRDEFHLQFGARILSASLRRLGVAHVHEEFDDGHMSIAYRYDRSLAFLSKKLST